MEAQLNRGTNAQNGLIYPFPFHNNSLVCSTTTLCRARMAMRLGTAIRALVMSAKDQTIFNVATDPTITAATHSQR